MVALGSAFLAHAPAACARISTLRSDPASTAVDDAERSLARVRWHDEADVARWLVAEPFNAAVALALLADRPNSLPGERVAALFPELSGLAVPTRAATYEHERDAANAARATPLLDHVFRAVARAQTLAVGVSENYRALLTTVLLFADVAKGGDETQRADWRRRLAVDGAVHNEDSAVILGDVFARILGKAAPFVGDERWRRRALALVASTGLVGMRLRGEVGRDALGGIHAALESETSDRGALARVWSMVNHADTAAVRAGLWTDVLARAFVREESAIIHAHDASELTPSPAAERIARLRHGALADAASIARSEEALARLGPQRALFEQRFQWCRVWYAEAALGALSLDGSVRVLALLCGASVHRHAIDVSRPWHLDLLGIVAVLRADRGEPRTYPIRLLEALVENTALASLSDGRLDHTGARPALVSFPATKGREGALLVRLDADEEATALLTLLAIYERKEAAAFHATLKSLCDLYGLRKDDFDRVANEANYLATMNAARTDKARMLDYVVPGLVVEVGPGGGIVLDLLHDRYPDSRVVGLDASAAVIEALQRKIAPGAGRIEVVQGDAFQLPDLFGRQTINTVVFCSVLHEIFSYVPWAEANGEAPQRFRFGSVEAIVAAAFRALAPGGRIIVRDGVMPDEGSRVVEFTDPEWRAGLDLFAKSYEPRLVRFEALSPTRVRVSTADLYEFITTYTWGPAAFPYEIREQRAVLPRVQYVNRLIAACESADPPFIAREVAVAKDLRSYLQPGYPANIAGHIRIFDATGTQEVPMPDVNGVWVLEKWQ